MDEHFTDQTYPTYCDRLAVVDPDFQRILSIYGYPPSWKRPNTFQSLVHIILEQQVSLASALSALNKLKERLIEITPEGLLLLTDAELKDCYLSRQKSGYIRNLAEAIVNKHITLEDFERLSNDLIREKLCSLKGIGNWTVDVYLMFVLSRADIFPVGDLAAVNALKHLKSLPITATREELLRLSEQWKPYRTIATMLLWHYYLSNKSLKQTI